MAYIILGGEILVIGPPAGKEMEEAFAIADEAEVDESKVTDRGPGGAHYYDDTIGEDVVSWCFAYARKHPEDEYIQDRVRDFQAMNQRYRQRHGKNMLGYDATYFPEDAALAEPTPDENSE